MKKIIIYYIHSYDVKDTDELFDSENNYAPAFEKVKEHPQVQEFTVEDFIHALNTKQIDSEGVFAQEEVELGDWTKWQLKSTGIDNVPIMKLRYAITEPGDEHDWIPSGRFEQKPFEIWVRYKTATNEPDYKKIHLPI